MNDSDIDISDIFIDGYVRLYRQRLDQPFTPDNIMNMDSGIKSVFRINAAVESAMRQEAEIAAAHPFAWNPEFGYVTARPDLCGTGLEISALFHLEGLHLIGDLDPALNALEGLRLSASGCCGDGLRNAAHMLRVTNIHHLGIDERSLAERVQRVFMDLVHQETNARIRLVEELPRVFEDSIARALAVLRSCRLLSELELLDIISPLRLAANLGLLDHFSRDEANEMMMKRIDIPMPSQDTYQDQKEKDRRDAILADRMNKRFRNVRLNARAKELFS